MRPRAHQRSELSAPALDADKALDTCPAENDKKTDMQVTLGIPLSGNAGSWLLPSQTELYGVTYYKRLACIAAVSSDGEANPQVAGLPHAEHTVRIRQRSQGVQENSDLSRGCVR